MGALNNIRFVFAVVSVLLVSTAAAQVQPQAQPLALTRQTEAIQIDGRIEENIWKSILPLAVLQKVPNAGAPPSEQTEIRITYDSDNLYLSCKSFDREPALIVANTKKRDDFTENTEWCGFLIDSYNDRENALAFFVTPTGAKLDMALANDIEGASAFNVSWNTYWDAAAVVNEKGWFAEIKVPFSSLRFESVDGKVIMGITAFRYLARHDETDIFPPRDPALGSTFKPSLTQRFLFEGIKQRNPVHLTTYALSGMERTKAFEPGLQANSHHTGFNNQVGLDAKIALRSNITLDLTLNTDFAQVEADDQQINLTRLNLFFPEKRLFFQERSSLFEFGFGETDKVFHSRRIGIVDGIQTPIIGGVKAFGRFGKWEAGLLNMQSAKAVLHAENFGVFRLRRSILNDNSTVGFIATNRTDFRGNQNTVYGLDATLRLFKQNYLSLRLAQSLTDSTDFQVLSVDPTKIYVAFEKRTLDKFTYGIDFSRAGAQYNPSIGFEQRQDFSQLNFRTGYNVFPGNTSRFLQYGPYQIGSFYWDNGLGLMDSRSVAWGAQAITKMGWSYDINYQRQREVLPSRYTFPGGLTFDKGSYDFGTTSMSFLTPAAQRLSYMVALDWGQFYNGRKAGLLVSSFFNLTSDLVLEGRLNYNRIVIPGYEQPVLIRLAQLKVSYSFSTRLFVSGTAQVNNITQTVLGNFRLRYSAKEGNDFYLVYNAGYERYGDFSRSIAQPRTEGTLLLKYSHTFHK